MQRPDVVRRIVRERTLPHDAAATGLVAASGVTLLFVLATGAYIAEQAARLAEPGLPAPDAVRLAGLVHTAPVWFVPLALAGLAAAMASVAVVLRRIVVTIGLRRDATLVLAEGGR